MFAEVNSVRLYYQKTGSGKPLVMLHGNTQTHSVFLAAIKELSKDFTVYAIDSRSHGKSTKVKELNYSDMECDIAQFIEKIIGEKVILFGLSDGAIIGLLLAINHPQLLTKLICAGASTCPDGSKSYAIKLFKFARLFYPVKMKMLLTQPSITDKQLNTIKVPTVVIAGEKDMIKEENTRFIAKNIAGSELNILKGESHTSYAVHNKKLANLIKQYIM